MPENEDISKKKGKKKPHRSPTEPAEGKSRAFDALATFEQDIYKVSCLPLILKIAGSLKKPGPYDLDHGPRRLLITHMCYVFKRLVSEDDYYNIKPGDLLCTEASEIYSSYIYISLTAMLLNIRYVNQLLSGTFGLALPVSSA